jgi:hypothetical protein
LFVGGGAVFGFEEYGEEGGFGAVNRNGMLCVVLGIQIKFVGAIQNTGTQSENQDSGISDGYCCSRVNLYYVFPKHNA